MEGIGSAPILRHFPGICVEERRKMKISLLQNGRAAGIRRCSACVENSRSWIMRKVLLKLQSSRTVNSTTSVRVLAEYRHSCWTYRRGDNCVRQWFHESGGRIVRQVYLQMRARSSDQYYSQYVLSVNWYQWLLQTLPSQCGLEAWKTLTNYKLYLQHKGGARWHSG